MQTEEPCFGCAKTELSQEKGGTGQATALGKHTTGQPAVTNN